MYLIEKVELKEISTKYGLKQKYIATFKKEEKKIVADSWLANWNRDWKEGMEVKIEDNQWQSREYNGKTYWTVRAPEGLGFGANRSALEGRMSQIEMDLAMIKAHLGIAVKTEGTTQEAAQPKDIVDEVPF